MWFLGNTWHNPTLAGGANRRFQPAKRDRHIQRSAARRLLHSTGTDNQKQERAMIYHSLMAITDNRKRLALLTLLTFATMC